MIMICKYKGNNQFEVKGSNELIVVDKCLTNHIISYPLIENKNYLILEMNKNLIVLPYFCDVNIKDNSDISINNNQVVLKNNGDIDINNNQIIIKKDGDIAINITTPNKVKINNKAILTNGAIITAPNGPCTITQDGQ